MLALFGMTGSWEWLVVIAIALLIVGTRLPALVRALARSVEGPGHDVREGTDSDTPDPQ